MARQRRSSAAEDFFESVADLARVLPYWVSLPIAGLLYLFITLETSSPVISSTSSLAGYFVDIFLRATFKYFIPIALVVGALVKLLHTIKGQLLFSEISNRGATEVINKLSWRDFEFLLSEWFAKQGYSTEITGGGGADGGIDIKMYKSGGLHLVQCKHFKSWRVSVHIVREFFGVMTAENAVSGFIVTSGKFTKDARSFATGKNMQLLDGRDLVELLDTDDLLITRQRYNKMNVCPKCSGELHEKNGKFGHFLSCSNYPRCKFTKDIK